MSTPRRRPAPVSPAAAAGTVTLSRRDVAHLTALVTTAYLGATIDERAEAAYQVAGYLAAALGIAEQLRAADDSGAR